MDSKREKEKGKQGILDGARRKKKRETGNTKVRQETQTISFVSTKFLHLMVKIDLC